MLAVQPRFGPTLLAQSVAGRRLRFLGHLIFRDINPMSSCWLISPIIPHVYISISYIIYIYIYHIYIYTYISYIYIHIYIYYINVLSDYETIYRNNELQTAFTQPEIRWDGEENHPPPLFWPRSTAGNATSGSFSTSQAPSRWLPSHLRPLGMGMVEDKVCHLEEI